jgi:signal peptidase II
LTRGRLLFAGIAVIVFILDRVTKALIVANVPEQTEFAAIPHVVWITHVQNAGAAFGVAPMGSAFFLVASVVVAVGLIFYVIRTPSPPQLDALLGLVLGGTVGNGYDRMVHGTVTDFIALHFWPVFNVADSAISVGVALLLVGYLLRRRPSA